MPPDELPTTSVSSGRKGQRDSPQGISCSLGLSDSICTVGRTVPTAPKECETKAEPPPWPWGLTKAKHAQGLLPVPHCEGLSRLVCLSLRSGLGLCPAPPSLGPLLEGQGVRLEGPGAPLPTLACVLPALRLPSQAQVRLQEESHQGSLCTCPDPNSHPRTLPGPFCEEPAYQGSVGKPKHGKCALG